MKLLITLMTAGVFAFAAPPSAEKAAQEPPKKEVKAGKKSSLRSWFRHWKLALQKSVVEGRYRRVNTTSVAAVRGSGQKVEDPMLPYWKGKLSDAKKAELMKERRELEKAVDLILAGKLAKGGKALDAFETKHPKSSLLGDVAQAKAMLAELEGKRASGEKAAPEKTAKPAGQKAPAVKKAEKGGETGKK